MRKEKLALIVPTSVAGDDCGEKFRGEERRTENGSCCGRITFSASALVPVSPTSIQKEGLHELSWAADLADGWCAMLHSN